MNDLFGRMTGRRNSPPLPLTQNIPMPSSSGRTPSGRCADATAAPGADGLPAPAGTPAGALQAPAPHQAVGEQGRHAAPADAPTSDALAEANQPTDTSASPPPASDAALGGFARRIVAYDEQFSAVWTFLQEAINLAVFVGSAHAAWSAHTNLPTGDDEGGEDETTTGKHVRYVLRSSASGLPLDVTQRPDDDTAEQALRHSAAQNEQVFSRAFFAAHAGSVAALREVIDALYEREAAQVPPNGITSANIDERDWEITYKLPALMLVQQLPKLCAWRGVLRNVALFDTAWQKVEPGKVTRYTSLLRPIYAHMQDTLHHQPHVLAAAHPVLTQRMAYLIETGNPGTTAWERSLIWLILEAVHRIEGRVLYEALGEAFAHLPKS